MDVSRLLSLSPGRITGLYLIFGLAWIGTTDWLVVTLLDSQGAIRWAQTIKGWLFVFLSALLILGLTSLREEQLDHSKQRIETAMEQLQVMHRVFRHNIRNDVTVIRGYIEVVLKQLSEPTHRDRLQTARDVADDLSTTGEKITVVDRTDLSPSSDTQIDVVELVETEVDSIRRRYPDATVTTVLPADAAIRGDSSLRHAIREILENAIEHNHRPESDRLVSVSVSRTVDAVEVTIEDNGPSIDPEEIEPVRTREETPLTHASGIGLWLTNWLVNRHDGDVLFDADDTGTTVTFDFRLPERSIITT